MSKLKSLDDHKYTLDHNMEILKKLYQEEKYQEKQHEEAQKLAIEAKRKEEIAKSKLDVIKKQKDDTILATKTFLKDRGELVSKISRDNINIIDRLNKLSEVAYKDSTYESYWRGYFDQLMVNDAIYFAASGRHLE